ncbi:MAG: Hsp20/alpha crystallin family protein [Acidimicrobiia bacterium]|nr:Hsp20/alpha crystallin family protein [Acidimicrobiia bacterium]
MSESSIEKSRSDWLEPLLGRLFDRPRGWPSLLHWDEVESGMRVEEQVEGDELVVRAEMPGIDPDKDVRIHVRNHTLELDVERREETKSEEKGRYRSEFRYGRFSRVVQLPPDADESDVKATYKDGILEVRMPLDTTRGEVSRIEVQRG